MDERPDVDPGVAGFCYLPCEWCMVETQLNLHDLE